MSQTSILLPVGTGRGLLRLVVLVGLAGCGGSEDAGKSTVPLKVRVSEIPDRVQIIGRLNHPLGELIHLRGRWIKPKRQPRDGKLMGIKDPQMEFVIMEVNGDRLDAKVTFARSAFLQVSGLVENAPPSPQDGEVWEVRGFESGGFRGIPADALEVALGPGGVPDPSPYAGVFIFETQFHYVSRNVIEEK